MTVGETGADVFGERSIDDLLGEALRRHRHGALRPLWRDMPESEQKRAWRRLGMKLVAGDGEKSETSNG